jgi:hypothetical protein
MSTFDNTYGPAPMLASVAEYVRSVEDTERQVEIHTITLTRNGTHGEFDLVIEATDDTDGFLEDRKWEGIAHRYGGVAQFGEVTP